MGIEQKLGIVKDKVQSSWQKITDTQREPQRPYAFGIADGMQVELAKQPDRCLTAEELSQKIKLHPTIISYTHDFPGYFTPHEVNRAAIRMANSPEPTVVFKDNQICLES